MVNKKRLAELGFNIEDYTWLENPVTFKELFKDTDSPLVEIALASEESNCYCGFVGAFSYFNNEITPHDGDSYTDEMLVYGYKWFCPSFNKTGNKNALSIVTDRF